MNENEYDYIVNAFTKEEDQTNLEVNQLTVGCITSKNNHFELDQNGNLSVNSITAKEGLSAYQTVVDFIYPVGSIYLTVGNINPNTVFGGTWEQIKDCFLLASGDTYEVGQTGGEATHTLTVAEMPSHTHTIGTSGGHVHNAYFKEHRVPTANYSGTNDYARKSSATYDTVGQVTITDGAHTHAPANTGGNLSHNNMPPYLTVNVWKRVE